MNANMSASDFLQNILLCFCICSACLLLFIIIIRIIIPKKESIGLVNDLKKERDKINEITNKENNFSEEIASALNERLITVNNMIACAISSKKAFEEEYKIWHAKIFDNRDEFLKTNYLLHKALNPDIINSLESKGLSENELAYVCLYAIGLRGKEVGTFMCNSRHYHINTDIRKKLGLDQSHGNLAVYIKKLFDGTISIPS